MDFCPFIPLCYAMTAKATAAQADKNGTASAVETFEVPAFSASSGGVQWTLTGSFPLINGDAAFSQKLYCAGFAQCVYRSTEGRKVLPDGGGEVDFNALMTAITAITFRGEERPNKDDKAEAEKWIKAVKAGIHTPEVLSKHLKEKYGYTVEITVDGLAVHEMRKRLKREAEKKAEKPELGNL